MTKVANQHVNVEQMICYTIYYSLSCSGPLPFQWYFLFNRERTLQKACCWSQMFVHFSPFSIEAIQTLPVWLVHFFQLSRCDWIYNDLKWSLHNFVEKCDHIVVGNFWLVLVGQTVEYQYNLLNFLVEIYKYNYISRSMPSQANQMIDIQNLP